MVCYVKGDLDSFTAFGSHPFRKLHNVCDLVQRRTGLPYVCPQCVRLRADGGQAPQRRWLLSNAVTADRRHTKVVSCGAKIAIALQF